MTKPFKNLLEIDNYIASLYTENPKLKNSKLGYAYTRFYKKNFEPTYKLYNERLTDIRVEHALEDPTTKALVVDNESARGFKYSKEGMSALLKEERKLQDEYEAIEIKIEPYFIPISMFPSSINSYIVELLENCLIENVEKIPAKKVK